MISTIRKFWCEWFGRGRKEEQQITSQKRQWDFDDEPEIHSSLPKRRRLIGVDPIFPSRCTSDDFLCPDRDFDVTKTMASSSIFGSSAVHSNTSLWNLERRRTDKTAETKENIIAISDNEDDDDAEKSAQKQGGERLKPFSSKNGEKQYPEWHAPKRYPNREQFLTHYKPPLRRDDDDSDIQLLKVVEQKTGGVSKEFAPYRRLAVMERRRELSTPVKMNSLQGRSKSSPNIPRSQEKMSLSRKASVNQSFRLEEKKKYSELLQKYTRVPVASPLHTDFIRLSNDRPKASRADIHRNGQSGSVEFIDLTKQKDQILGDSGPSEIEVLDDEENILASKMGEVKKTEYINNVLKETKENPLYDPHWTSDLTLIYDHKRMDRRRKEEQEKMKLQLRSQKNQEMLQDFLEQQIQTHMRITEVALPEEVILDDEALKLPKLTTQMERMVNMAFQRGNQGEVLVEHFNQRITRRDILTLSSSNWLNDEVINFYMNLLIERGKEGKYPTMYGFNTFFYPKLVQTGHSSLKRWTRKIDIFAHDILIVPVHLGVHWCMAAIDQRKKSIRYFDSMGAPNRTCLEALLRYLEDEKMDKKQQKFDRSGWKAENVQGIPQQMNGSDCGMFACMYAEFLCRDAKINFTQADMPYFRRKMAYEILSKKLLL